MEPNPPIIVELKDEEVEPNPPMAIESKDEGNDNIESSEAAQTNDLKKEPTNINISSTIFDAHENANQNPIDVDSSEGEIDQISQQDDLPPENANNQLVLYDSSAAGGEIVPVPDPDYRTPLAPRSSSRFNSSRILPSVGAFTVQCANCFKWRLIPTKEKYEQIREHILEKPFYCETAREWRPEISCDDPTDISQDGSRLWAIDKPNIAQPPPGWQRLLRIRAEGGTKFADVYYQAPSGKRLRSMVEVEKYLTEHPHYQEEGVRLSQFSFQIPRPLQENYVRKRPARPALLHDGPGSGAPGFAEPSEVNPIAWISPDDTEFHLGGQKLSNANGDASVADLSNELKRRKA